MKNDFFQAVLCNYAFLQDMKILARMQKVSAREAVAHATSGDVHVLRCANRGGLLC